MDLNDLYSLDKTVWDLIQETKKKKETETKAFFDGMEKGADLMMKAVKTHLEKEAEKGGVSEC